MASAQESEIVEYPNGNKWNEHINKDGKQFFIQVWDEEGNELLTHGTGSYSYIDSVNNMSTYEEYQDSIKVIWYEIRHLEKDTIFWKSEVPAIYDKGEYDFYKDLEFQQKKILNHKELKKIRKKEKGKFRVFVVFIIDKEGNMSEIEVPNQKYEYLIESHIQIMKQLKGWRPAIYNGEKVKYRYILPFAY